MATVTETATFLPEVQLWKTPMRTDNTPMRPGSPIGRVTWFGTFNTAAKITTNVVELAIALNFPLNQYALRLMNLNWDMQLTTADAVGDINDWHDQALLTIPTTDETLAVTLFKNAAAQAATITNLFANQPLIPGNTSLAAATGGGMPFPNLRDPFLPLSPMIFRSINVTANASAVMTWTSHMWAYLYTIEQYRQDVIWTTNVDAV